MLTKVTQEDPSDLDVVMVDCVAWKLGSLVGETVEILLLFLVAFFQPFGLA